MIQISLFYTSNNHISFLISDNHDHHSNSSSQSLPHVMSAPGSVNNLATSVVNVTKKTELPQQIDIKTTSGIEQQQHLQQQHQQQQLQLHQLQHPIVDENVHGNNVMGTEDDDDESQEKPDADILIRSKKEELLLEPKNEYDDGPDDNVEDLTMEDEEDMDDEHAGPSHGGEGSSQGNSICSYIFYKLKYFKYLVKMNQYEDKLLVFEKFKRYKIFTFLLLYT